MAPQPLSGRVLSPFGVELDGDLSHPLGAEDAAAFVALYREHGLVVARGQRLSRDAQTALLAHLGPILHREGETGMISTERGGASLSELRFHADGAYASRPLDALSLHAVDVVDGASSTRFVSAERAWAKLDPMLRDQLAAMEVEMISPAFEILGERACDRPDPPFMQRGIKPAAYRHAALGVHCLWVSEMHAARIVGLDWEASWALLDRLFSTLYAPGNLYEHR